MSENRDARPGAVPARPGGTRPQQASQSRIGAAPAPPVPVAAKVGSPRAPAVAPAVGPSPRPPGVAPPRAPSYTNETAVVARPESEPPVGGWDEDDTVEKFPDPVALPAAAARQVPGVQSGSASPATQASPPTAVPATPASPGTMRGPYQTSPGVGMPPVPAAGGASAKAVATAGLGREEVWTIVRAAVEEAVAPLVARQRELEARVERAERAGGSSAASRVAPAAAPAPSPASPVFGVASPLASGVGSGTISDVTPAALAPSPSLAPTGYGVTVTRSMRPSLDLSAVGPVDIEGFDGGARKRRVAGVVVILMLLLIAGAITMTVLSHS